MSDTALAVLDVNEPHFNTASALDLDARAIVVSVSGNADMAVSDPWRAFLQAIDAEARRLSVDEMVFELRELYFMNSSCLSVLMRMIHNLVQGSGEPGYRMRFKANPNLRWQKRSLLALSSLARDRVIVE
jgi:anti-anti-sigma factor